MENVGISVGAKKKGLKEMLRNFLYISAVCSVQTLLASYGVAYASHGHDFPEDLYNPCDVVHCEDESIGESAEENTEESTEESADDQ
jgi:hypothetical protein